MSKNIGLDWTASLPKKTLPSRVVSDRVTLVMEKRTLVVRPGQKFMHIRRKTIYIVKSIRNDAVTLISEDGKASMLIQMEDLIAAGFKPAYD